MENKNNPSNASKHNRQQQGTKKQALINYVASQPYIDVSIQLTVCKAFGLPLMKNVFRKEYRKRFYNFLYHNLTTCATVEASTGIPQKYLTTCKSYYEKKNLLKVVELGTCPTTNSKNVQFITTNPQNW